MLSLSAWLAFASGSPAQTPVAGRVPAHWLTEPIWPSQTHPIVPAHSHAAADRTRPPAQPQPSAQRVPAPTAAPTLARTTTTPAILPLLPSENRTLQAQNRSVNELTPPNHPVLLTSTGPSNNPSTNPSPSPSTSPTTAPVASSPSTSSTTAPVASSSSKQVAALVLETVAPLSVAMGQPLTYEIHLHNTSLATLHAVTVQDELPAGYSFLESEPTARIEGNVLTWNFDELPAHSKHRLKVRLHPNDPAKHNGILAGTATATFSIRASHTTRIDQPKLHVGMTAPTSVVVGEPLPFEITLHNLGMVPLPGVLLRDQLPNILEHPHGQEVEADIGPLAPGEKRTITLRTTAARAGVGTNRLTAISEAGEERIGCEVRVVEPGLQLRCEAAKQVNQRGHLGLTIEVANPGTAPTHNAQVQTVLPEGFAFVSATEGGTYDPAARTVTWTLGTLAAGSQRSLSLRMQAVAAGDWLCRTSVHADSGLSRQAEVHVHIEGIAALQMEVVDLVDPVPVGGETEYEIRLLNQGTSACTGVRIVARVPEGLAVQQVSGPTRHSLDAGMLHFEPVARLAARADVVYRVRVRGVAAGDQRFRVEMTCDQLRRPVIKEESTHVFPDDLPESSGH